MTRNNNVRDEYLDWMYNIVCDDRYSRNISYRLLFEHLNETEFTYILPMDANRWEDGVNLRYRFGDECGYDNRFIASYLDTKPCSVLEMMIALAVRCEVHIMDNQDLGNRVGQWFWEMIVSLKLGHMNDQNYDPRYVDEVLDILLSRSYAPNGEGGLFTVKNPQNDMRKIDIWYQMHSYLNEYIEENGC